MIKKSTLVASATVLALAGPASAASLKLSYLRSFDVGVMAQGVAFDAAADQVLIANDSRTIRRFARDGAGGQLSSFEVKDSIDEIRGIGAFGTTFLGAQDDSGDRAILEFDGTGATPTGALFIDLEPGGAVNVADSNGVAFDPVSNTIFHADENDDVIREFTIDGTFIREIDVDFKIDDAEGIEIDPFTGNLLVADDLLGGIFVFDRSAVLLQDLLFLDLLPADILAQGFDPLGLAIDRMRNELYVAQGDTARVDVFAIAPIPLPGAAPLLLAALGAFGVVKARKRRTARGGL